MSGTIAIVLESGLALRAYVQKRDSFLNVPIAFVLTENSEPGLYEAQLTGLETNAYYYASFVDASTREVVGYTNIFQWDGTNAVDQVVGTGGGGGGLDAAGIRAAVGLASANLDIQLGDIPTTAEFNARTLPSADYFDPAADPVATVTNLTNLPTIPTDWLSADGLANDAVTEIQSGLSTLTEAQVNAQVDIALADYDAPTRAEATADKNEILNQGNSAWATATGFSTHSAADIWAVVTRTITGGTITTNNDKSGYSLSSAGVQAIWDALTSGLTTVGSIGKQIVDNLNATVSSRSTFDPGSQAVTTDTASREASKADVSGLSTHSAADVWTVGTRTVTGGTVTASNMRGTDNALLAANYTAPDNSAIANTLTAAQAAELAAKASADGRFVIDYTASTATQYNADGTVRTVFNLRQADGTTPATTAETAVERVPQ